MKNLTRENAEKIDYFYAGTLDKCVEALIEYKEHGKSVVVDFNGHDLYSCDVTMDSAYKEVLGKTKAEFDKECEEAHKRYLEEQKREEAEAKQKIPSWIERGEKIIYPERFEEWKKCVDGRASDLYHGEDLEAALELMEKLESGVTLDEVVEAFDAQNHSGASAGMTRRIIFSFSKRGPEFWEQTEYGEITPETRKIIEDKKQENIELEGLNTLDVAVNEQRKSEELQILKGYDKKTELIQEIKSIEVEIEEVKAREAQLKKQLTDKQEQLNSLE